MNIPRASIWPNVVFDTTSAKGMAAARAWATTIVGDVPQSPPERRTGAFRTQGAEKPETDTQPLPPPEPNARAYFWWERTYQAQETT